MMNIMIGEPAGKLLTKVSLSNNTVSRKIHHTADDLNDQLIEKKNPKKKYLGYNWIRLI